MMRVAILGAGKVGRALGAGLEAAGHGVVYGRRGSLALAVDGTDAVILAVPWSAVPEVLAAIPDFGGRPLLDATNPVGPGLSLTHGHTDSGAEQVQRWAPTARVAKAFNTVGWEIMAHPAFGEARAAMLVSGEASAVDVGVRLATDLGFEALPFGGIENARLLEPMALTWIRLALQHGQGRAFAFGLLRGRFSHSSEHAKST